MLGNDLHLLIFKIFLLPQCFCSIFSNFALFLCPGNLRINRSKFPSSQKPLSQIFHVFFPFHQTTFFQLCVHLYTLQSYERSNKVEVEQKVINLNSVLFLLKKG